MSRRLLAAAAAVALTTAACKKGEEAPTPPAAPIASSAPMRATAVRYDIEPAGKTSIDMPAPKERIKGETTAAKGVLHVDLANLASTRGDLFIDLDTFSTHTFGNDDD